MYARREQHGWLQACLRLRAWVTIDERGAGLHSLGRCACRLRARRAAYRGRLNQGSAAAGSLNVPSFADGARAALRARSTVS